MKLQPMYINKSLIVVLVISAMLAIGFAVAGTPPPNFAGTWTLDKSRSKDLPRQFENVESYKLVVTQDPQQLTVEPNITRGARSADRSPDRTDRSGDSTSGDQTGRSGGQEGRRGYRGGNGMGGRFGGGGMGASKATFRLDGKESTSESADANANPSQATYKAKLGDSVLELTTTRNLNFQGNSVTMTTRERWELADGGKTLKVHRTTETPRGVQESNLVFNRE